MSDDAVPNGLGPTLAKLKMTYSEFTICAGFWFAMLIVSSFISINDILSTCASPHEWIPRPLGRPSHACSMCPTYRHGRHSAYFDCHLGCLHGDALGLADAGVPACHRPGCVVWPLQVQGGRGQIDAVPGAQGHREAQVKPPKTAYAPIHELAKLMDYGRRVRAPGAGGRAVLSSFCETNIRARGTTCTGSRIAWYGAYRHDISRKRER